MRIFRIVVKALIGLITVLVLIMLINFIPTIRLGHAKMSVFVGDWVNVYYETIEKQPEIHLSWLRKEQKSWQSFLG